METFFDADDGERLRFDLTPVYSYWQPATERLHQYNPAAKIILLFRDPIDRAFSHWSMQFARGNETLSFDQAIREERERIDRAGPLSRQNRKFSYVERGFYAEQVRRVLALFPRENVLFLRSTDLLKDHPSTLSKIAEFLDIEPFPELGVIQDHKRPKLKIDVEPTPADRAWIARMLKDDLPAFAELTGLDIAEWRTMREIEALDVMEEAAAE